MPRGSRLFSASRSLYEAVHHLGQVQTEHFANRAKFEYVQATLAAFILADNGLVHSKFGGELSLAQTGLFALMSKHLAQSGIVSRVDTLLHTQEPTTRACSSPDCA